MEWMYLVGRSLLPWYGFDILYIGRTIQTSYRYTNLYPVLGLGRDMRQWKISSGESRCTRKLTSLLGTLGPRNCIHSANF